MDEQHCAPTIGPSGLSRHAYWTLSLLMVAGYLALWLAKFRYVYGWHADDWACYVKGLDTIKDPKAAFTVRANALQPYFYLYSYLPIRSGLSVPSYELPIYGELTGNFRFFLLWTILYHGLVALSWVWFAGRIAGNRTAALISTFLLLTSQEFVLWTPQPETRFIGLPLALVGLWLMLRPDAAQATGSEQRRSAWRRAGWLFLAGSLFGLAQSLHYTVIYLIVPVSAAVWLWELPEGWRRRGWWLGWAGFAAGCLWLHGLLELASRYWVGSAWHDGPTMALWQLNNDNLSPFGTRGNWLILGTQWMTLIGWPLTLAAMLGVWVWMRRLPGGWGLELRRRVALVAGICLAGAIIFCSATLPYFRKLSNLQPFVFLAAAMGVLWLAGICSRRRTVGWAISLVLLGLIDAVPLRRSAEVFRAHLGLGRAIHWVHQHRGSRELRWLVTRRPYLSTPAELLDDDPNNWLITYFPFEPLLTHPTLAWGLATARPLYRQPTLWATEAVQAVHGVRSRTDVHRMGALAEARVYRVGDLAEALRTGDTLRVAQLRADSVLAPEFEPANLFDHDAAPDHITAWVSDPRAVAHRIEIILAEETELDRLGIVQRLWDATRIEKLHLRVAQAGAPLRTAWIGCQLQDQHVIDVRFKRQPVQRIELQAWGRGWWFAKTGMVQIEEILVPGLRIEGPPPTRALPPLVLHGVEPAKDGTLLVHGEGITAHTCLLLDGRPLRPDNAPVNERTILSYAFVFYYPEDWLRVSIPERSPFVSQQCAAQLSDGLRRSNVVQVEIAPCAGVLAADRAENGAAPPAAIRLAEKEPAPCN